MAITVTLPIAAPTGLSATLQSGGSLDPNTTYYYVVIACDNTLHTPNSGRVTHHSPLSAEDSFTTDTTNLSALIQWTNVSGAAAYNILLSKTSGDYSGVGAFETTAYNVFGNGITDGSVGYTITAESTYIYVIHSAQLVNPHIGGISNDTGVLNVRLSGTETEYLSDIYDAIVSAGYSDYVFYDGFNFILKGWIYTDASDSGTLIVERKNLIFIKGGVINKSLYYTIRFGRWDSDETKANYNQGCNVDIQHCRYPFYASYSERIEFYGSKLTFGHSLTTTGETLSIGFYVGGSSEYPTDEMSKFRDSLIPTSVRGNTSDVYDLKWGQGNNFSNVNHVRLELVALANMPYSADLGMFYDCDFFVGPIRWYSGHPNYIYNNHHCYLYDCRFQFTDNNMIEYGDMYFGSITPTYSLVTDQHLFVCYSINLKAQDVDGNPLENVTVNCVDKDNNPVEWIEHEGGLNRLRTGNKYTTDRTTDANGKIDYYIKSYRVGMDQTNTDYPTSFNIDKTDYFPFTITFSKSGYKDYSVKLNTFTEPFSGLVTMEIDVPQPLSVKGLKIT